jgi:PAS domain S-box-containing protein
MRDILQAISGRAILAAGIGLILILVAAAVVVLALLRGDAAERAEWHLENIAAVTGEQLRQSVQSVDLIIAATVRDLEARSAGSRKFSDRELFEDMRERARALPHVRNLLVLDRDGNLRINSREFPAAALNLGDREYFRIHRERRLTKLYVAGPVVGRATGERVQAFSRRVEQPPGDFKGVVVGTVQAPYFNSVFESLGLGAGGRVYLFRDDGVLLMAHPPDIDGVIGRSFAEDPLFREALPAAQRGSGRRTGLTSGKPRVIAYEHLRDYPFVLVVSSTEEFILAGWRRDAWRIGAGAMAAAAVIGMALFFLLRQQRISASLAHDLLQAGQRLSGIIHSAMDAVITIDEEQRIVLFNEAAEEIFGCPAREAIGSALDRFIPERFRAVHGRHVEEFERTGTTARRMGIKLELSGLRMNGEEFPIDASISQVAVNGKKFFTVILRDVTQRKRSEEALERSYDELRELSATMNEVREAERARIARELHDELAQWLTALRMDVSWLASRLPREHSQLLERTEKMKEVMNTTVNAVRRIAADLRPVILDDLGLVPALEGLLHDLSQRTGIVVSLEADHGSLAPGEPVATAVYRMVQEALTNVARHAKATEVQVTMNREGETLVVRVRDNGRGFDPELAAQRKSYGVLGIRERAYTLGGSARIVRVDTGGTLVEIEIPMTRFGGKGTAGDTRTAG